MIEPDKKPDMYSGFRVALSTILPPPKETASNPKRTK